MGGAPCNVEPRRRLRWRGLGRRRRKLPAVRLGGRGGGGGGRSGKAGARARGLLRRWLTARWLRRAVRRLAAIYMAALTGPPAPPGASAPWIGVDPCFATPFMVSTRPCSW